MTARYMIDAESNPDKPYFLVDSIRYNTRYGKEVKIPSGRRSDGATGAWDINSEAWWIHDEMCRNGCFFDGAPCTNWQASTVLSDVLKRDGHWFRATTWFIATLALGGGKARDNGIFKLTKE